MINIKINGNDIQNIVRYPVIKQSKSFLNIPVHLDETVFTLRDDNGSLLPFSQNSIIDNVMENNDIEIYDNNNLVYTGILNEQIIDPANEKIITFDCRTILKKFIKNRVNYKTWLRGDGTTTYPTGEYSLKGDGYYYETPIYAIWHYLRLLGYEDYIYTDDIDNIHSVLSTANVWIQIDTSFENYTPHEILNYICKKFHIFIYVDELGNIRFLHDQDIIDTIDITDTFYNKIESKIKLEKFTDYNIQLLDDSFRTAYDNSDYGAEYRTEYIEKYELLRGIIYIYDSITADYLGEMAIDNFYRDRLSLIIKYDLSILNFNLRKAIKITVSDRGWFNKIFEPYVFIRDYNNRASGNIIETFETL